MHVRKRKKRNAKGKILIQWKKACALRLGPTPRALGFFKNLEFDPKLLAFH